MSAPIALITDFGLRDAYVGVMKGVVLGRNPEARFVDLTHEVPPQDVRRGAYVLATSVPYFPTGTVFLAVVDPGVGTERHAIALAAGGWYFVAPDNGVLAWTLRFLARRQVVAVTVAGPTLRPRAPCRLVRLTESSYWRQDVSTTFHGRDVFAPIAAELSLGRSVQDLGRPVQSMLDLPWPISRAEGDMVVGEVVTTDTYGNLITNLAPSELPPDPIFQVAGRTVHGLARHFQAQAPLLALIGSNGLVELAAPNASAEALLGATRGAPVDVRSGVPPES